MIAPLDSHFREKDGEMSTRPRTACHYIQGTPGNFLPLLQELGFLPEGFFVV